jgi:hypothetical protein
MKMAPRIVVWGNYTVFEQNHPGSLSAATNGLMDRHD